MSNPILWLFVEGDDEPFIVTINSPDKFVAQVQIMIKEERSKFLQGISPAQLTLWKVRGS